MKKSDPYQHWSTILLAALVMVVAVPSFGQDEPATPDAPDKEAETVEAARMTPEGILELIRLIDADAVTENNSIQFELLERTHIIIHDSQADRMRLLTPIAQVDILSEALMYRMLQANYDSALDSRYAVANGIIWSVFIHPLGSLSDEQLASAISQVHTAAETFGTTFSSSPVIFGGGDSQPLLEELEEALRDILQPTT